MQIPVHFINKTIKYFHYNGEKWIRDLPNIINQCIKKWDLTNCTFSNELSINLVCFAQSSNYGDVVLKIGGPHHELYTEMKTLCIYEGRNICKCYDFDVALDALLIERIVPGNNLTSLQNTHEQLMVAADLIYKLPIPINETYEIPTYDEWVNNTFKRAREENVVGSKMISLVAEAESLFREIENHDSPKALLHGDLHHWNILQDSNGDWKAIDPHGVIGIPCMESASFIDSYIDIVNDTNDTIIPNYLDEIITVFSDKFGETKRSIGICVFVLRVLSICWTFEEVKLDSDKLIKAIDRGEFILNYIKSL